MRALVLASVMVPCAAPRAAEPSNAECLACHGPPGVTDSAGRALAVDGERYAGAAHGILPCTTCHADAATVPHEAAPGRVEVEPCAACHAEAVAAHRGSVHGVPEGVKTPPAASCADCHGDLHTVTPGREPASPVHWTQQAGTCARCHARVPVGEASRIPVVRPVEAYLGSTHARAVQAGRRGAVCADCHGSHAITRSTDPRSSIWPGHVPETCGGCHATIFAAYRTSVHGEALERGVRDAPSCTDCHGEHRILGVGEPASPVFAANLPGETCGRCHARARFSEKYGLAPGQVSAFRDSYHGLALRAGRLSVANCSSCHGVHDIRPSADPRSHVHGANLGETCGKCHPGAGSRFAVGPVHGSATSAGMIAVGWVRAVYLWLIGLVIGGMVVHNALDLARKARFPVPAPLEPAVEQPERMPRALRWQHRLVMATFPTLVYSGFALTYPESWWAAPFLGWEAQWGLRGLLHRAAAIVMTGAVVWHVGHVATSRDRRACLRAMLPSWQDLRVLRGTLAYHFGRRPHPPRSGTFTYAEKAEYWAFMWGTVLMTGTGALLWGENFTLAWLPGWVPQVATAIHFYEAVLATLAIVVWHFYWVIFDPAVYPMDWTWWTGRSPAARARERLPEPSDPPPSEQGGPGA